MFNCLSAFLFLSWRSRRVSVIRYRNGSLSERLTKPCRRLQARNWSHCKMTSSCDLFSVNHWPDVSSVLLETVDHSPTRWSTTSRLPEWQQLTRPGTADLNPVSPLRRLFQHQTPFTDVKYSSIYHCKSYYYYCYWVCDHHVTSGFLTQSLTDCFLSVQNLWTNCLLSRDFSSN